jgi:hypothetical protein
MPGMKALRKLRAILVVVAVASAAYLLHHSGRKQTAEPSSTAPSETLPNIAVAEADAGRITRIELTRPDDDDNSRMLRIAIEKQGADWEMTWPLRTRASTSKVEALIGNLKNLYLWTVIDHGTGLYDQYDLSDTKALHIVAWKGDEKATDVYCGKSIVRGQLARIPGKDGILALVNWGQKGYQGFLYTRSLRSWRETSILKFEEDAAIKVEITNRNGVLLFSKSGGVWTGSFTKNRRDGQPDKPKQDWKSFDESKVTELLRAYKSLSADDFGDEGDKANSGVDRADQTGGVIRIGLQDQTSDLTIRVGRLSGKASRYAPKDGRWATKDGSDGTLFVLSSWTAGWATAGASSFENARRK